MFCSTCGQPFPEGTKFCHKCGASVAIVFGTASTAGLQLPSARRNSKRGGCLLLVLLLIGVAAIVLVSQLSSTIDKSTSDIGKAKTPDDPRTEKERAMADVLIDKFSWYKHADVLLKVDLTIVNNTDTPVKDLEVTCTHSGPSGTRIDSNRRTIYEIIRPHSKRRFRGFDMGFIHSQATKSGCNITDLVVMK